MLSFAAKLPMVSALVPGVAATMLQAAGQRVVPAAQAQPIYASMPLFAAGWAALVLNEPISATQAVGGLGACSAALLASTGDAGDVTGPPASGKIMASKCQAAGNAGVAAKLGAVDADVDMEGDVVGAELPTGALTTRLVNPDLNLHPKPDPEPDP